MVELENLHDTVDENTHTYLPISKSRYLKSSIATIQCWRNDLVTTFSPFHIFLS
jgi:hypothetical protein